MKNIFLKTLLAEMIIIAIAITSFVRVPDPRIAGFIAGCFFVGLGLWILLRGIRDRRFRRSFAFAIGIFYLLAVALPLMIVRFMNYATAFEDIRILWMSGPVFHKFSTVVYSILMAGTAVDWLMTWLTEKRQTLG